MSDTELLTLIADAVPETQGNMQIERIRYVKSENHAYFSFTSDVLVGEKAFLAIERIVAAAFKGIRCSIRVASPSLGQAFLENPEKYAAPLNQFLLRHFPAVASWEFDMRWVSSGGRVTLETPDDFSREFLEHNGVRERLSAAIKDVFRLDVPMEIRVRGDQEARLQALKEEREKEEAAARERAERERQMDKPKPIVKKPKEESSDRIKGRAIAEPPVPISELTDDTGLVVVRGKVLSVESKELKGGEAMLLTFLVTDFTGTIRCKMFLYYRARRLTKDEEKSPPPITQEEREAVERVIASVKEGIGVLVRGNSQHDNYAHETVLMARDVTRVTLPEREDKVEEKRVELHLHTQMSNMDAVSSATALIERAAKWGHKAVAITDHGVVQAFPEAFSAAKKYGIKLIPGIEGYLTDDDHVIDKDSDLPLDTPIVVLDFETTGLNTAKDRIIEIGAVRLENGAVTADYSTFVQPGRILPAKIIELTGITDMMLKNAPTAEEALPKLMEFIGDCPIAAHNSAFDLAVLTSELKRLDKTYDNVGLDTLTLSRKLYPEMKSHRLAAVCKRLSVSLKGAHRAVNDAAATAQCLSRMIEESKKRGAKTLSDLNEVTKELTLGSATHITLLATNRQGLENINRMVSEGHLHYFHRRPHIPRAVLQKNRAGVLVGSACEAGELFQAVVAGESDEKLLKIARFYDYLEVQPLGNNAFLVREGRAESEETLKEFNKKILWLGEKIGIPVVATGDVHFLDPHDSIFREILQTVQGFEDGEHQPPLYFHTTEEMLREFDYLPFTKAKEIVVDNPQKIADKIENITLFPKHPEGKTTFSPLWTDAADFIKKTSWDKAHEMYGEALPEIVEKRLDKELNSIIGYGYATLYNIAHLLVSKSLSDGYLVGSRGSVGSSLVATMCGITEVNPLPPHYRCAHCRTADFDIPPEYTIGIDLPDKNCPVCGEKLIKEGFDIPFEVFLGFKGDKVPDIDLNFSGEYQPRAHAYVEELFGKGYVFRAGTIGTLAEKTAFGYVLKYLELKGKTVTEAEKSRLAAGCVGVKRTTGQHPGGMVVLPREYEIYQFTAVQHPADDASNGIVTTHYDFGSMHDILVKLDILGHDDPTMMHMLEELTGIHYLSIPLDDKKVMSLFSSPEALGVTQKDIDCTTGTLGVPEFGTSFVRQMLDDTKPTTMQELIRISGLSHGTDVWLGNAKDLIVNGIAPLSQCLCTRDDIMNQLMAIGVAPKMAFDTMENVRKGKGLKPEMEEAMREHNVPQWFVDSCKKIQYMFPKGHAVAYVTMALRVAWYKVYHPLAYYAAYFTIRGDGFDAMEMLLPIEQITEKLNNAYELDAQKLLSAKDKDGITAMEMVREMLARGFSFLPADLYKSDVRRFLPENDKQLRVPFTALGGLGESAAEGIAAARSTPFLSIEDLKERAKVSSAVIELLRTHGCLDDLAESSQVSLF